MNVAFSTRYSVNVLFFFGIPNAIFLCLPFPAANAVTIYTTEATLNSLTSLTKCSQGRCTLLSMLGGLHRDGHSPHPPKTTHIPKPL